MLDEPYNMNEEEIKKCQKSPWYFATKYLIVDGERFKTDLTEEEYNERFKCLVDGYHNSRDRKRG